MMEDKNNKGMQELDDDALEQAAGGAVEKVLGIDKEGNYGYIAYNPMNKKESKYFDNLSDAARYSDRMGWKPY